jgi:molybdopterin-guanine dinucleotide biosynthesis protein A
MALRVAAAMRAAGLSPRLVARDGGLADLGLPVLVEDAAGPVHPLNGVAAGLAAAGEGGALFAPCDLPWLPPEAFARLLAGAPPRVAGDGEGLHPLVGWYPASWGPRVAAALASGASAWSLAEAAEVVVFPREWLINVNRRGDLR